MQFTDIFIRRPVFATVLSLILLVAGLAAIHQLPIRQYPKTDVSAISIQTSYPGANANLVESFISQPIEDAVSGIDNVDYITSTSTAGSSSVVINLKLNTDINQAMVDVQSKLSSIIKKLPEGVEDPVIEKNDPNTSPILILSFTDSHRTQEEITDYLTRVVLPDLSNITGVSEAMIYGTRTYAIRIWLDPKLMAAHGITASEVKQALQANNVQAPAGKIDRQMQVVAVNANTTLNSPEQFNHLIIQQSQNQVIRLQDIGHAELGASAYTASLYFNNQPGIGVGILAKSNANPIEVTQAVRKKLQQISNNLPTGIKMEIMHDSSLYIHHSLREVTSTIIEACLFVILVIFLFIGSLRAVIIPVVTIPLSLIGVCSFMLAMGYTLNALTFLAFVLAIGMVVDDAIVVLENIHRYLEQGKSPVQAALIGAREIRFAVIAMTLTLAAVFAPIGMSQGLTGALFREFAFTLAGTIIISGFIALTLSPMMCSQIIVPHQKESRWALRANEILQQITEKYQRLLRYLLARRSIVFINFGALLLCGGIFFFPLYLQSTLAPQEDQGYIVGIISGPTASNITYTEKYTQRLSQLFSKTPELDRYVIINGIPNGENSALSFLALQNWDNRHKGVNDVINLLNPQVNQIPGITTMLINPSSLPGADSFYPMQLVIKSTGPYSELSNVVNQLVEASQKNPRIIHLESTLKLDKPELNVEIDRNKANDLGISMSDIATALNVSIGAPRVTSYVKEGLTYDVIPQLLAESSDDPAKLNLINLQTSSGKLVPLSSIVKINSTVSPTNLDHFQQQRAATINVILRPDYSMAEAVNYLKNLTEQFLPENMSYDFSGQTRQFLTESSSIFLIFCFSLMFIYLVLSAQFESFRDPFIVLLSVPVSLAGALATLFFMNGSLNIYTEIGLIALIGLISKHGILIVEFSNQLQKQGRSLYEAVIEAASIRLRPILMTTGAMVLGAIPLALASGAGAAARQQMGYVVVGGLTFGTLFTLFVVPTFYTLLGRKFDLSPESDAVEKV